MRFFLAILISFSLLPLVIVIRLCFKRLIFIIKLKSTCRSRKYRLIPTHYFWWLGWTNGVHCDFHIITSETVYSVKMIGTISKRILYDFVDEYSYSVQNLMFQFHSVACQVPYEPRKKKPYQFNHKLPSEHLTKNHVRIILMNPVSLSVSFSAFEERRKPVENGDCIGEGIFYTGSGFIHELRGLNNI